MELSNTYSIPHIIRRQNTSQLIVKEKPFTILGGELHNSSSSSLEYMEPIWEKLIYLNCNTVIATVSWELFEPKEGQYDYYLIDGLIEKAREHNLHLVIIWFATWKNAISTYAPSWVKTDLERFPRMKNSSGQNTLTLSCFSKETCMADAKAFSALMSHIREKDSEKHTVIMMQVENEAGLLGSSRDYSKISNKLFEKSVPDDLIEYITRNWEQLIPELKEQIQATEVGKSWREVFGTAAEEVFMCWGISSYINHVAEAGKKEYSIPMYVNAWTVQYLGEQPGHYPSGGPVSRMFDIWKHYAPSIDFMAPDIYLKDFAAECASYVRAGNPLFIPEARRDKPAPANVFYALGKHAAIGFAPFGVESIGNKQVTSIANNVQSDVANMDGSNTGDMLSKTYCLLQEMQPIISEYSDSGNMTGILQFNREVISIELGNYKLQIKFNMPCAQVEFPAGGLIIAVSDTEYIIAGFGFSVDFLPKTGDLQNVDYIYIEEGEYKNGIWIPGRRLNGDEYHVRLKNDPCVIKASLYSYP
jgi:beta-galactosidase GanA